MSEREARIVPGEPAPAAGPEAASPPARHEPPPAGAGFMNALRWALFAGLLLLAGLSIGSYVISRRPAANADHGQKKALYHCPMHPSYTSDKPGECPICGMTLEPVPPSGPAGASGPRRILFYRSPMNPSATSPVPRKDEMGMDYVPAYSDERQSETGQSDVPGLAPVQITPERIQLIGVRTAVVTRERLGAELDLVGFVVPDESRIRRVQIRVAGWVQKLHVSRTGEPVAAGQPLLSIYSPELYQSEREFLIELAARDTMSGPGHDGALPATRERLLLLGVPEEEIQRVERERQATTQLTLRSPVAGTVLERGVSEGQYVGADTPLFTVVDLSSVWVLADLYEQDLERVRVGDRARFTTDALPERPFTGTLQFIYPTVSAETRTIKARLVLENPDALLRPGLYGRVRVESGARPTLVVPTEAVVNTGEHRYVFLARTGGLFEPRMITVGHEAGDRVEILKGLAAGDTVVASASFLIDSESRLKAAISGMGAQPSAGHPH
jgi:multidrug efflux pump subunit AcrA (membrane-fusion protein)